MTSQATLLGGGGKPDLGQRVDALERENRALYQMLKAQSTLISDQSVLLQSLARQLQSLLQTLGETMEAVPGEQPPSDVSRETKKPKGH